MKLTRLADELEGGLRAVGDTERAVGAKAYLKSDLEFLGVAAKPLRAVARAFLADHPETDRSSLIGLVQTLWNRPVFELKAVAVALLERRTTDLVTGDLALVEDMLRRSHTWALVDWLCTKVVAPLVESDPETARRVLERWSRDDDFWVRRASLLAQLPALRAGGGDFELFSAFASRMVGEKEFFIRKAIGWVLRDVSKKRPDLSFGFLSEHIHEISGLTLREGSRYLSKRQREALGRARR
ncbi:MAG: DNA alkylation repair protein [Acidobacteriota bacterium]